MLTHFTAHFVNVGRHFSSTASALQQSHRQSVATDVDTFDVIFKKRLCPLATHDASVFTGRDKKLVPIVLVF